jgi:hypothetical protein
MKMSISHRREDETIESKTRWFKSLSVSERAEIFNSMMESILEVNPGIAEKMNAKTPVREDLKVLTLE